jgi:hypothetical protein|tara:strand:- start:461 stop:694 length:234 start_codon:yes stop_codon:yes gene_type:complete
MTTETSNVSASIVVNSAAISTANYMYEGEFLSLTFKGGGRYVYFNVPRFLFQGLQESSSKGKFIHKYVLGKFNFRKI